MLAALDNAEYDVLLRVTFDNKYPALSARVRSYHHLQQLPA